MAVGEPGLRRFGLRPDPGDVLPPEVIAEHCVHSHLGQASCRACVDACPRGAFVLDDARLGIDTDRCDACGLCVPACPQSAVLSAFGPAIYRISGDSVAFAACAVALPRIGEAGILPCLHALGLSSLLALRREGVTHLVLCRGDCQACARGCATTIETHLEAVRQILEGRGLVSMSAAFLAPEPWVRARGAAAGQPKPGLDRRAFFRQAVGSAVEHVVRRAEVGTVAGHGQATTLPGRYFPTTGPGQLAPFVPNIDQGRCNGCDACARLCPSGAIRVYADAYRVDADACTGCRICADVCTQGAMTIEALAVPTQTVIALYQRRCRACGAPFHTPKPDTEDACLCRVCNVTNHHRRLYQVLD